MAANMAPETIAMACLPPTNSLPQTDKPNLQGAAVIPEGIVNTWFHYALLPFGGGGFNRFAHSAGPGILERGGKL